MTQRPDRFDQLLADGLRDRAAHAPARARGFADVRRRVRHRRQRQMAVGLLPAAAAMGWVVTRPTVDGPLPSAGDEQATSTNLDSCGDPVVVDTTVEWSDDPTTSFELPVTLAPPLTTIVLEGPGSPGNPIVSIGGPTETTIASDTVVSIGGVGEPAAGVTLAPPPWTGPASTLPAGTTTSIENIGEPTEQLVDCQRVPVFIPDPAASTTVTETTAVSTAG